jgi:multicomponent Na+:H+ antiporter subunit E
MPTRTPAGATRGARYSLRSSALRAASLLGFWVLLIGPDPADLAIGVVTAVVAARVSLRLLPPRDRHSRVTKLALLGLRVPAQSLAAGFDIARRALDPRLPVQPGYVSHPLRLSPGLPRDVFCALTSVVPGTVPSGTDARGALRVHVLDANQPVAQQLTADEARVARAFGEDADV